MPTWSANTHPITVVPFTSSVGPTFQVEDSPIDVFQHFLPDQFLQNICVQTNLYAEQVMGPAKYLEWKEVNVIEMKAYIGFSVLMGLVRLPAIEDYWKVDPHLHYAPIADRISRQRFRDISRYIHFVDNTQIIAHGQPGYDKLGKVRPVIEHCSRVFEESYNPHRECAIDKAMIPFQGRSSLKQYMPVKRGIKVWVRADSHNGYFSQFQIYKGKGTNMSPELGLGGSVVKQLSRPLVGKFHHVFMDNFFYQSHHFQLSTSGWDICMWHSKDEQKGFPPRPESETNSEKQVIHT